jgi:hypothetical protein
MVGRAAADRPDRADRQPAACSGGACERRRRAAAGASVGIAAANGRSAVRRSTGGASAGVTGRVAPFLPFLWPTGAGAATGPGRRVGRVGRVGTAARGASGRATELDPAALVEAGVATAERGALAAVAVGRGVFVGARRSSRPGRGSSGATIGRSGTPARRRSDSGSPSGAESEKRSQKRRTSAGSNCVPACRRSSRIAASWPMARL